LKEYEAQGVPFTAQLDDDGMISWGIDPAEKDVLESFEGGSWRAGVTGKSWQQRLFRLRLMDLTNSKATEYILNKISLEGIDPHSWMPLVKNLHKFIVAGTRFRKMIRLLTSQKIAQFF
jgi:hypothetical protein